MKKLLMLLCIGITSTPLCAVHIFKYLKPVSTLVGLVWCNPSSTIIEPRLHTISEDTYKAQELIKKEAYNFNHLMELLTIRYLLIMALYTQDNPQKRYSFIIQITQKMETLQKNINKTQSCNLFISHEAETLGGLLTRITGNIKTIEVIYNIHNPKKE